MLQLPILSAAVGAKVKKLLLASVASVAVAVGSCANAADLGVYKAPPPVAPPIPVFTWTGCYVGAHAGVGWGRKDFQDDPLDAGFIDEFEALGRKVGDNTSGFVAGAQAGCDYQVTPAWVFGAEFQLSGAEIEREVPDFFTRAKRLEARTDWLASITGRVGYSWDRWLFYAKGGAAWAKERIKITEIDDCGAPCGSVIGEPDEHGNPTPRRTGWTVGAGVEWAFWNNWSWKLEYQFYDLGSKSARFFDIDDQVPYNVRIQDRIQSVKFGVNYRLNWGTAPVVAKY
jgi:outer membrane immunogenic protein